LKEILKRQRNENEIKGEDDVELKKDFLR